MASSKLLLCMVLYCLQITTDARSINLENYNIEAVFKISIEKLYETMDNLVEKALGILEQYERDVVTVGYIDIMALNNILDKEEENAMAQLNKIENENNKVCVDKARDSYNEIRVNLEDHNEDNLKKLVEEDKKVAEKGKVILREHLKVPDDYLAEFNACSDEQCQNSVTVRVLIEIHDAEKHVKETLDKAVQPLEQLLLAFGETFNRDFDKYKIESWQIVVDAEKCGQK